MVFSVASLIVGSSVLAQASTDILKKWNASNKFKSGISIYCAKGCKATKKYTVDPAKPGSGSLQIKIAKSNLKSLSNIQLTFISSEKIEKGTKYKIQISLKSDQAGQIVATAIMHVKPWSRIGEKAYATGNLLPNKSKDIILEFTAKKDFKKVRVPCIYLGKLKPGTKLNIKSIVFEKISS